MNRGRSERGSLVLVQSALLALLVLALLLAYPQLKAKLGTAAQNDKCGLIAREKGNDIADPLMREHDAAAPGSARAAMCPPGGL